MGDPKSQTYHFSLQAAQPPARWAWGVVGPDDHVYSYEFKSINVH